MLEKLIPALFGAAVSMSVALPSAQAQTPATQDMTGANVCLQSVNFPKPFGESDLKGNAKLPAYCDCFMAKFNARAAKKAVEVQTNPGKSSRKSLQESHAEELAMRNSCRKEFGLPQIVDPVK